ncbi:hypothetical protein HYW76_01290 [Candidatus Pacearchaeota archaeon]|nr:hypothetical protein [Candidatus Pacearchaeota archaeon]
MNIIKITRTNGKYEARIDIDENPSLYEIRTANLVILFCPWLNHTKISIPLKDSYAIPDEKDIDIQVRGCNGNRHLAEAVKEELIRIALCQDKRCRFNQEKYCSDCTSSWCEYDTE